MISFSMLEPQFHAKQLSQVRNAIVHVILFVIFSRFFPQIWHHVAGPLYVQILMYFELIKILVSEKITSVSIKYCSCMG